MFLRKLFIYLKYLFIITFFLSSHIKAGIDNCDMFIQSIEDKKEFDYPTKTLNDLGIFFQKKLGKNGNEEIIRDKNNYPKVYFSVFEKEKLKNGTVIKSINKNNLSKISDSQLTSLIKKISMGTIEYSNSLNETYNTKVYAREYESIIFLVDELFINTIGEVDAKKGFFAMNYNFKLIYERPDLKSEGVLLKNDECRIKTKVYEAKFNDIYRPDKEIFITQFDKDRDKIEESFGFYQNNGNTFLSQFINGTSKIRSKFNFSKFPFDTQPLEINIISGLKINAGNEITQIYSTPNLFKNIKNFKENNFLEEWKVQNFEIKNNLINIDNSNYDSLKISINIKRNSNYYIFKIIIPVLLILLVAWSVLWIPPKEEWVESRLTTSIVALLSLIAYNFVFLDDIPKLDILTSLDLFVLLSYLFCAIPIFTTIFLSRLLDRNPKRAYKRNKAIRFYGGAIYIVFNLFIFLPI